MKRLMKILAISLIIVVPIALCVVYCGDEGCPSDKPNKCNDGECHACCQDDECLDDQGMTECSEDYIICNDDYECECICRTKDENCSVDPGACCTGLACDIFTNTCMDECTGDADCIARAEIPFHNNLECKDGACDFNHCTLDEHCAPDIVCFNGDCVTIPPCSDLKECVVLPGSAVTKQGTTSQFAATPYLNSGAVAPGFTFSWSSDDATVAAVAAGTVTGGAGTGSATITATVDGCTGADEIICTADVTNYGDPPVDHSRVVAVDELTNEPIAGATVVIGTEAPEITDALGVAEVAVVLSSTNPQDITVSKQDFNYVTLRAVESDDVIVHMGKLHQLDFSKTPPPLRAGGVKGEFNFKMIRCEPPMKTCEVSFGLGGLSIPGNLVNLNFDLLIGGMIITEIELGGDPQEVPLPSGLVLCLSQTCFKQYFKPTGIPGNRVAWGLGGKLDLADLIEQLGPLISGGTDDLDIGALVAGLLPMFANFYTAMAPNVDVDPKDMVLDFNNINDDKDDDCCCAAECPGTDFCHPYSCDCQTRPGSAGDAVCPDMVPDYDNFPPLNMTLKVKMDQTMTFTAPDLPANPAGGYYYDGVIIIGGVIVRGAGLVPLGLSAGLDSLDDEDTPDGKIDDPIQLNISDVAGRIPEDQVQRVIVALAMNVSGLAGSSDTSLVLSGQVMFVDDFSGSQSLAAFMTPAKAIYERDSGLLQVIDAGTGHTYSQVIFTSDADDKVWHHLGNWAAGDYTLPTDPDPQDPRNHTADFINIKLKDGDYQSLVEFNDGNMGNLVESVASFCFLEVPECYVDADCAGDDICDGSKCKNP